MHDPKGKPSCPLSAMLPPLILGTATFNSQYNDDPYALATDAIVVRALDAGVRAFDTSPYYGPAETLLGAALAAPAVRARYPRSSYKLLTKAGRLAGHGGAAFDYSPASIRHSVMRSCRRLATDYLDVVYCHDVEFVTAEETVAAVRELRRLRDEEGLVRYVGISGYPIAELSARAERVLHETGESLDAVMSYANYTMQNRRLARAPEGLARLTGAAGVDVVPSASPLGMGLLRAGGVPVGADGDFHPAPAGLRAAVAQAAAWVEGGHGNTGQNGDGSNSKHKNKADDDKDEDNGQQTGTGFEPGETSLAAAALRFALESWLHEGAVAGGRGPPPVGVGLGLDGDMDNSTKVTSCGEEQSQGQGHGQEQGQDQGLEQRRKLGVSVLGVSNLAELDETLCIWRSILDGFEAELEHEGGGEAKGSDGAKLFNENCTTPATSAALRRRQHVHDIAQGVADILGPEWLDYVWASPGPGFVRVRPVPELSYEFDGEAKA